MCETIVPEWGEVRVGDVVVVANLLSLAGQWPVEPGLFQGCAIQRGFPLLPAAACPYSIGATLAQGSMQSDMLLFWFPGELALEQPVLMLCPWGYGT